MVWKRSASVCAIVAAGAVSGSGVGLAQVVTGTPVTVSPSSANVLNLLAPFLSLNANSVGQATLSSNLAQAIATNNSASLTLQQLGESDENLLGSGNGTTLRTTPQGGTAATTFGVAANLGGGLPAQAVPAGGSVAPMQAVGGLGAVLGAAFANGIDASTNTTGPLARVATFLNNGYNNFTSTDLGVAKNYFADGGASSSSTTNASGQVTSATTHPAVAPAGYTLPTYNGLPNTTNSVYDVAYGVTNTQSGQDVFGSSRPDQVAASKINSFDPTALNGIATNPSFPSGHTTYAYTDSILLAMLVPQEYQSMLYRASAYANSRIVVGVHYPLDIIASRGLASYDLAQAFTNPLYMNGTATPYLNGATSLPSQFAAASAQLTPYLTTAAAAAGCGASVAACAASAANTANDPYAVNAANAALYTSRLTYGLPTLTLAQAPQEAAPTGGPDASILLAPVYGGSTAAAQAIAPQGGTLGQLSTATINGIIVNTENTALAAFYGTSLSYWTRIDLAAAAGYFGNVVGSLSLVPTDVVKMNVSIASGGALAANGSVNGTVTVNAGGVLAGSAAIGSTTVAAGAVLAPGSFAAQTALAAGTPGATGTKLAVNGTLTLAPGSTLAITASPTQITGVSATGAAALNGATLALTLPTTGSFVTSKTNAIVTAAGGLSGSFGTIVNPFLFATPTLSYDANDAYLSFGSPNFRVAASTSNERNVANGLSNAAVANPNSAIVSALQFFTPGQVAQAQTVLNSLSGEGITATQNLAHRESSLFTSAIFDQTTFYGSDRAGNSVVMTERAPGSGFLALAPENVGGRPAPAVELADLPAVQAAPAPVALPPVRTWRVWGSGFGGEESISGNAGVGYAGQQNTIYGGAIGVDYQITPNYLVGVAVGGSEGDFNVAGRATSGSTTGGHVAFYDLATFGPYYGASSVSGSFYNNRTVRNVAGFGALGSEVEHGNFFSDEVRSRIEFGRQFANLSGFGGSVTPFVALELADLRTNSFGEQTITGAGNFALNVSGQDTASVPAFVGARFRTALNLGNGMTFVPTLEAAFVHEFAPYRSQFASIASLPGAVFLVDGARPARNSAAIKAGGEFAIGPRTVLFANFDGEFSGVDQFYAGKGGIKYLF